MEENIEGKEARIAYIRKVAKLLRQRLPEPTQADLIDERILPIAEKDTYTEQDIKDAMSITCFQNLGYCCGLKKRCPFRDVARVALNISDEEFQSKERWVYELLKNR